MKRILYIVGSILTALLLAAAGLALLLTTYSVEIDVTPHKERVLLELSERSRLEIRVDGDLQLQLGPRSGLRGQGLHIRNPALKEAGELLTADIAALEVETLALLSGRLEPTALNLEGGNIQVERDKSGRFNWDTAVEARSSSGGGKSENDWLTIDSLSIRVRDSRLTYADRRAGAGWEARAKAADIVPEGAVLRVDLDGSVNKSKVRLKGTTTTLSGVMDAHKPVPLDLSGNLLGLQVNVKGTVANPWSGAQVAAKLTLAGKSLAGLGPWIGKELAAQGPIKARLDLKGGGSSYKIAPFELALGKGRFDGSLTADFSGKRPRVDLDLGIEEVDARLLFPTAETDVEGLDSRGELFTDTPLSTAWMDAADIQARIRVSNVITPLLTSQDLDLNTELESRLLRVDLMGKAPGGRSLTAGLEIDGNTELITAVLRVKGDNLMLEPLLAATEARDMIKGDLDLSLEVRSTGASPNQMMRSLSGNVLLLVMQAEADLTQLDRLTPGARNLFGVLARPNAKLARVNCGLAAFDFRGGKTDVRGLVDSPDSTVVVNGNLDLGARTLDIRFVPNPKGAHLKVAAPVVIYGSLASPNYRVEKGALLVSLTELASRIVVPQLLLVDAFGAAVAENPCVKIATGKVEEQPVGALDGVTKPVEGGVKGAGAVVRGAGEVIKGAGGAVINGTGAVLKGVGGAVKGLFGSDRKRDESGSADRPSSEGEAPFEGE